VLSITTSPAYKNSHCLCSLPNGKSKKLLKNSENQTLKNPLAHCCHLLGGKMDLGASGKNNKLVVRW
jgi:hypothetical protein